MLVRMAVRFAVRIGRRMRVPTMRVVDMPVLVKERFVHMLVFVFFGKMQIHARRDRPALDLVRRPHFPAYRVRALCAHTIGGNMNVEELTKTVLESTLQVVESG
jgi:hypothetical protein